ncbi:MAG: ribose-phosphate pyrophosphokinase [candidate division WOR-3 bacterium]|nr:ribose-phosphate pyrophosphokinase [candidate division WOR-3 bacterium]MDH5684612.1 ribose-phosphate pyrophosphokinase [candidate division WOR-3 bacterium]
MLEELKVFSGRANLPLAEKIVKQLGIKLGEADIINFADGEIRIKLKENVRGIDVFVIQPTHPPADNILELLLMIDALKRASADRITAVIPYYGYARQDRKDQPRVPISAKLVADLIVTAGANRVLTMDLHAEQIQGYFNVPVDHLYSAPILIEYFQQKDFESLVVISDVGRANRARGFAKRLGDDIPIGVVDKRRPELNQAEVVNIIGEVEGKTALIFDDIIDTGGTVLKAAEALLSRKATKVLVTATHPVFSNDCAGKLALSEIDKVVVTDTINLPASKRNNKIEILSVSPLLAEAIARIHKGQSVSSLFV